MKKSIKPRPLRLSLEVVRPLTLGNVRAGAMIFQTLWFGGCAPPRQSELCFYPTPDTDPADPGGE
jgi:hypothetical protein